jgi:hypothetical protein
MSPENCVIIRERINVAAEKLKGILPASSKHPAGRNPHAHIAKVVKNVYGCSYKDIPDENIDNILYVIDYCEKHPF